MLRFSSTVHACALIATFVLPAMTSSAAAQVTYTRPPRFEITPFGAYNWGGSFDTDAFGGILAGELSENDSFSWGVITSFLAGRGSAVELWYLRQDTDVSFNADLAGGSTGVGDFANNYIQLGFRQELAVGQRFHPFISGSMGVNVLDPKAADIGTSTRFSWSLGGGAKYMANNNRVGFRLDLRWLVTPVPSGTYGTWCDYWGCYVTEGTAWLHQGSVGGGLIFAF